MTHAADGLPAVADPAVEYRFAVSSGEIAECVRAALADAGLDRPTRLEAVLIENAARRSLERLVTLRNPHLCD